MNEGDVEKDIRRVSRLDWNVEHYRIARRLDESRGHDGLEFSGDEQVCALVRKYREHARSFAGPIRLLVGNKFYRTVIVVVPGSVGPWLIGATHPDESADGRILFAVFVDCGLDCDVAGRRDRMFIDSVALLVRFDLH